MNFTGEYYNSTNICITKTVTQYFSVAVSNRGVLFLLHRFPLSQLFAITFGFV